MEKQKLNMLLNGTKGLTEQEKSKIEGGRWVEYINERGVLIIKWIED